MNDQALLPDPENPFKPPQPAWSGEDLLKIQMFYAARFDHTLEPPYFGNEIFDQASEITAWKDDRCMSLEDNDRILHWLRQHSGHLVAFRGVEIVGCVSCMPPALHAAQSANLPLLQLTPIPETSDE